MALLFSFPVHTIPGVDVQCAKRVGKKVVRFATDVVVAIPFRSEAARAEHLSKTRLGHWDRISPHLSTPIS